MRKTKESLTQMKSAKIEEYTYVICVYANNDVYSEIVKAARVSVTDNTIILYDRTEKIIAIYPASCSSLLRQNDGKSNRQKIEMVDNLDYTQEIG